MKQLIENSLNEIKDIDQTKITTSDFQGIISVKSTKILNKIKKVDMKKDVFILFELDDVFLSYGYEDITKDAAIKKILEITKRFKKNV